MLNVLNLNYFKWATGGDLCGCEKESVQLFKSLFSEHFFNLDGEDISQQSIFFYFHIYDQFRTTN